MFPPQAINLSVTLFGCHESTATLYQKLSDSSDNGLETTLVCFVCVVQLTASYSQEGWGVTQRTPGKELWLRMPLL